MRMKWTLIYVRHLMQRILLGFVHILSSLNCASMRAGNDGAMKEAGEKLALKFFLAKAIALNTPPGSELPEHYLSFARSLTPNDIIVTFNWDLLLESAIECVGGEYCYNYEVGKIHIVKLHGSINWVNNTPQKMRQDRPDFGYRPLGFTGGMMDNEVFCSNELHRAENWHLAMSLVDEVQPMIILPGYGKAFDVRSLSILWYRLEALAIRKGGVSIIGLNVSHDDFIVESLFRYLLRSTFSDETLIRVVNPEPVVGSRFQRLAGTNKIEFHCELFSTDSIESALLK